MPDIHSHIGASSAYRWMNCPGSVRLLANLPKAPSSSYALTGTAAHSLCEKCLIDFSLSPSDFLGSTIEAEDQHVEVTPEMVDSVSIYVDKVKADLKEFGGKLMVESSFSLDWIHPGMFGRNDACIIPTRIGEPLRVYDYKNGRKPVAAQDNPQLSYYALGALGKDNNWFVDTVVASIIQPNSMDGKKAIDTWEVEASALYQWAGDVLRPAAQATEKEDAPCNPGEWCCFCEAQGICPAKKQEALAVFGGALPKSLPPLGTMTPFEIGKFSSFFSSEAFSSWLKAVQAEELNLLQRGVDVPGRALTAKQVRGNRKWADDGETLRAVQDILGEDAMERKLKSPAQMEKALKEYGQSKTEISALVDPLVTRDISEKVVVVDDETTLPKYIIDLF